MIRVSRFVVVGGPEIHAHYVRRLLKAEAAGRLRFDDIVVVDRDRHCPAAALASSRVRLDVMPWKKWLQANLASEAADSHLVPYHWAPHVLLDWLAGEMENAGYELTRDPVVTTPEQFPVDRATAGGDRALSYATWLCPPSCIEPALCPHTRGPKTWSLATELSNRDALVFPCLHLVWGVGTIPVSTIHAVRDAALARARAGGVAAEVATASHCHGLSAAVSIRPRPGART